MAPVHVAQPAPTGLCSRWSMVVVQGQGGTNTSVVVAAAAERPVCSLEVPQER